MLATLPDEEIAEKLALLKHYSREFDIYEARWKMLGGEKAAYNAMMDAEHNYVTLFDWLWTQGIAVCWNKERQEYIIKNVPQSNAKM
jgi:hypothetical protein